jgi:hypothetical protein
MSRVETGATQIRRSAEREHADSPMQADRRKSDSDAASAHPIATDPKLRRGHPSGDDRRDKPVASERDKDIKHGGTEGAARRARGG